MWQLSAGPSSPDARTTNRDQTLKPSNPNASKCVWQSRSDDDSSSSSSTRPQPPLPTAALGSTTPPPTPQRPGSRCPIAVLTAAAEKAAAGCAGPPGREVPAAREKRRRTGGCPARAPAHQVKASHCLPQTPTLIPASPAHASHESDSGRVRGTCMQRPPPFQTETKTAQHTRCHHKHTSTGVPRQEPCAPQERGAEGCSKQLHSTDLSSSCRRRWQRPVTPLPWMRVCLSKQAGAWVLQGCRPYTLRKTRLLGHGGDWEGPGTSCT